MAAGLCSLVVAALAALARRRGGSTEDAPPTPQGLGTAPPAPPLEPPAAREPPTDPRTAMIPIETVPPPPTGLTLTEQVQDRLSRDPRTSHLHHDLEIHVAEQTVYVRGSAPVTFDASSVREVVLAVPGVSAVDLAVATAPGGSAAAT